MAETLVVVSKVKKMVKDAGYRTGADYIESLSSKIGSLVQASIDKVKTDGNKKTLGAEDLIWKSPAAPAARTFRDYMEAALYDPEAGFYARRKPTEDFYTAPELHPAFGGVLAREIARRLQALKERGVAGPYAVVEMGSGSGLLARQVLEALRRDQPGLSRGIRYILVERCRERLLESVLSLSSGPERILGYSRLEELLPCTGVFLSNELVDSFPVHLLEKRGGEVREVYVDDAGGTSLGDFSARELEGPARAVSASLAEGERHAVNLEASRWLKAVSEKLKDGYLLTVDYGKRFGSAANPPRTFRRHQTDDRVTEGKGSKDLTASVDFDHLIAEGRRWGLALEAFLPMGRFLLEGGIEDWLSGLSGVGETEAFKARAKIKTLIHPEGMGETFKVLIQRKEPGAAAPGPALHKDVRWSAA